MAQLPVPLVISTQTPDTIIQAPQTSSDILTPSTAAFIQSLESIVAFIKEASQPSQLPPHPSERSQYDSEYVSEYDSEYNSEYDSEYGSEYDSEYYSEYDSECERKAQQSPKKKVESIVTVDKEEGTSRKNDKKVEPKTDLAVETLIEGVKKVHSDESTSSKSSKGKEPAFVANNLTHDTGSMIETFRSKDLDSLKSLDDSIHVFVDNSNILAGFMAYCNNRQWRPRNKPRPKLNYDALFRILENGKNVARKVLVASSPLIQPLTQAEQAGYEVSILKRIGQKEQCVDEVIHLKILESLLDHRNPSTLVLASGDGKDAEYFQGGFYKCVTKALERGWKVRVISWRRQLSQNFLNLEFLRKWKTHYQVVYLDRHAVELGCHVY